MTGVGFRSVGSALATAGQTWASSALFIKGMYDAGLLTGSVLRTLANRAAAMCKG